MRSGWELAEKCRHGFNLEAVVDDSAYSVNCPVYICIRSNSLLRLSNYKFLDGVLIQWKSNFTSLHLNDARTERQIINNYFICLNHSRLKAVRCLFTKIQAPLQWVPSLLRFLPSISSNFLVGFQFHSPNTCSAILDGKAHTIAKAVVEASDIHRCFGFWPSDS